MTKEVLAIGGVYLDINVPDFPINQDGLRPETELVGAGYRLELGGSVVTFARLCNGLGLMSRLVGKVGADDFGDVVVRLLEQSHIQSDIVRDDNVQTNVSFNMVNPAGQTAMAVAGTANQSLGQDEVMDRVTEVLDDVDYIVLGGVFKLSRLMGAFEEIVRRAQQSKAKVVLDHGRISPSVSEADKQAVRSLIDAVDIYLPSRDEFMQLWGVASIEDGLNQLAEHGDATVVVKDGGKGAVFRETGVVKTQEGFDVEPKNTVGAGDSFNAGFIAALVDGRTIQEAVRYANAVAALKISNGELPIKENVASFIA